MSRWTWLLLIPLVYLALLSPGAALAEGNGQEDLDEALRSKVTAEDLRDLNKVIELLESAIDKGLDVENSDFAEQMLAESLLQRGGQLTAVVRNLPPQNLADPQIQRVRALAVSDLRHVLMYDNPPVQAKIMLAQVLALPGGDQPESLRLLEEVMADEAFALLPPDGQIETYVLQADILRQEEKFDQALAGLAKAIELDPKAPEAYQERGEIFRAQEKYPEAIVEFDRVLELEPGALLTLIHRAEAHLNNQQSDEALKDIEQVLKDNPGLALAHGLRAQALASEDRLPEAIDEMKRLAEAAPQQPEFGMQLAMYYIINKQPRQAIDAYTSVLQHNADNFMALRGRADLYLNIGDHAAAIADFEKALKVESDDPYILNNFAWVLATSPEDALRDGKRAVGLATKAAELSEFKQAHILSTLAAAHAESGDFAKAREWSQKAVDLNDPDHIDQLKKELESYQQDKPWREKQTEADENKDEKSAKDPADELAPKSEGAESDDDSGDAPSTAESAKPVEP